MPGVGNTDFWCVIRPTAWPESPVWMSFSTLMELEGCPRRWALTNAEYTDLWNSRGYPFMPQTSALEGTIVHLSLQKITGALVKNGCSSLADENAIFTLRQLGGYTAIITDSLEQVLLPYIENPRTVPVLGGIRTQLTARVPELRARVQRFLSRIRPVSRSALPGETATPQKGKPRHALQQGTYTEVPLQASELRWSGVADMLTLSSTECEIRDFKTGAQKEEHKLQLLTYALLWIRDTVLNPSGRLANKLVLSYEKNDVEVPSLPTSRLKSFEEEIKKRSAAALAGLKSDTPQAKTNQDNCRYCTVRHLCEDYWEWLIQQRTQDAPLTGEYMDIQIRILAQHGPTSWDGIIEASPIAERDTQILIYVSDFPRKIRLGNKYRLLNAKIRLNQRKWDDNTESLVAVTTMNRGTELFELSQKDYFANL